MFEFEGDGMRSTYGGDDPDHAPTASESDALWCEFQSELALRRQVARVTANFDRIREQVDADFADARDLDTRKLNAIAPAADEVEPWATPEPAAPTLWQRIVAAVNGFLYAAS